MQFILAVRVRYWRLTLAIVHISFDYTLNVPKIVGLATGYSC